MRIARGLKNRENTVDMAYWHDRGELLYFSPVIGLS